MIGSLIMRKFLLLPVVALGLVAWAPSQAKAGAHVDFGIGVPAFYYGPSYGPYCDYPGYGYYDYRDWHHGHDRHHDNGYHRRH
jgi:hypothetical protein